MKSISVKAETYGGLNFHSNVSVRVHLRSALAGTTKQVALGFSLSKGGGKSDIEWFEPRLSALEIVTNFQREQAGSMFCESDAESFVSTLPRIQEGECANDENAQLLERVAVVHFTKEIEVLSFEPYSLDEGGCVDVYFHYRMKCLSARVPLGFLLPFINQKCLCPTCVNSKTLQDAVLADPAEYYDDHEDVDAIDDPNVEHLVGLSVQ